MSEKFDIEFIRWSLDARTAIQAALLNLAVCHERGQLGGSDYAEQYCELSGIAFSLWRSAFLASLAVRPYLSGPNLKGDKSGPSQVEHAADLVRTILSTNAVLVGDDRRTQFWMGQYYIDNAGYRLYEYIGKWPPEVTWAEDRDFTRLWSEADVKPDYVESAHSWNIIFNLFIGCIRKLMKDLRLEIVVRMEMMKGASYKFVPRPATLEDHFGV